MKLNVCSICKHCSLNYCTKKHKFGNDNLEHCEHLRYKYDIYRTHHGFIKQFKEENEKLKTVVDFYADEYKWISRTPVLADVIHEDDIEQLEMTMNMSCNTGGKLAREIKKELKF